MHQSARSQKMIHEKNATAEIARQRLDKWRLSQDKLTETKTKLDTICTSAEQRIENMTNALEKVHSVANKVHEHTKEVEQSLGQSTSYLVTINAMLSNFEEKVKWLDEKKNNLAQSEEDKRRELEKSKHFLEGCQTKAQDMERLITEEKRKLTELEKQQEELKLQIKKKESNNEDKKALVDGTRSKSEELCREKSETRKSIEKAQKEAKSYMSQLTELEEKKEFINKTHSELGKIAAIEKHAEAIDQYERLVQSCQNLGINIESFTRFQKEASEALEQLAQASTLLGQRKKNFDTLSIDHNKQIDEHQDLQQKLDTEKQLLEERELELKKIESDGADAVAKMNSLQEEMNALEAKVAEKIREIHQIKDQISAMAGDSDIKERDKQQELNQLVESIQQQREKNDALNQKILVLQEQSKSHQQQLNWLKPDIDHLTEELVREKMTYETLSIKQQDKKLITEKREAQIAENVANLKSRVESLEEAKQRQEMQLQQAKEKTRDALSRERVKLQENFQTKFDALINQKRENRDAMRKELLSKSIERKEAIADLMSKYEKDRQMAEEEHLRKLSELENEIELQQRAIEDLKRRQVTPSERLVENGNSKKSNPEKSRSHKKSKVVEIKTFSKVSQNNLLSYSVIAH